MSKLGLNIILFISNMYGGFFLLRAGLVVPTSMPEKKCNGNPESTKMLKLDRVATVDNRPSTDKNGGPIQLCVTPL